ncbi:acyl-CoA dehydrogenase [Micromonospora sp. HNM0581]|uniref:acyl-CoA dehydrogenase family protein n=1 Tax=Micromonospora sp. HNM0581 TaxID=2716341 RepID=UPI00146C604E|nr:acyl-CoA dehydrogenase family protein [Micromonospora sp. HNM0581]NLU78281.1 acyl-CoA dehydrogenase [Micromonospora sp. HNM0581]
MDSTRPRKIASGHDTPDTGGADVNPTRSRVAELASRVAKRADEIEQRRGLPDDLLDDLRAAGCFRMLAPASHGGDQLDLPDVLTVLEQLARADAATAWTVGQVALSHLIVRCGPAAALDDVFADGPDTLVAGAVAPKGRARTTEGGWRLTGQWPFVTGCPRARWFYLNCVLVAGRSVPVGPDGVPTTRILFVPASEVRVVDTWRVLGLRGTASHDVAVDDARVPEHRAVAARDDDAVHRIAQSSLIIGAVAVGLADGALADLVRLAVDGKRPALSARRLATSTVFQDRLGEAQTVHRAARALLYAEAVEAQSATGASTPLRRARLRAAAAQVTTLCAQVVDTAHTLAGGSAIYETSPLQRRLRDMRTATQHFVAGRDSYATLGALAVGEEAGPG